MKKLIDRFVDVYDRCVLDRPVWTILCLILLVAFLGYHARDFRIDASAETLLLENDKDLFYARKVNATYGVHDFLIISYSPKTGDLLSDTNLKIIGRLRDELKLLKQVSSVMTILDLPLLESPPVSYSELSEDTIRTLESPDTDRELARQELKTNEFYKNMFVSPDLKTTAIVVYLHPDKVREKLAQRRNALQEKQFQRGLSPLEEQELETIFEKIRRHNDLANKLQHQTILTIRNIMDKYRSYADLFLGGVGMIADDMISFIKNDLKIFGFGVFILLVVMLGIIFRGVRWVVLPMLCCFVSVLCMMGVLGLFGWEVTVISSNFVSLQLIITLAVAVHLIVRYREFQREHPDWDQKTLVQQTVRKKFIPCLYATLTTIAGFCSLLLCDILPVINFGWMMSVGIFLSLLLTFVLFPAGLLLVDKQRQSSSGDPKSSRQGRSLPGMLARFTQSQGPLILVLTVVLAIISIFGISRLEVENSFIDYFKESTEIYQGMKVIDQQLGGTTPLDVIIRFDASSVETTDGQGVDQETDDLLDPFADEEEDMDKYWFTDNKLDIAMKVHDYLDGRSETGKVLSLGILLKIAQKLNDGKPLDSYEMSILYAKMPDNLKQMILYPFVSIEKNEMRFAIRVKDSLKTLRRDAFLKQVRYDLIHQLGIDPDHVRLAGTMVLYNNMLQSLFRSQILTLGLVALALLVMFLFLFRNFQVAIIALMPNLLASGAVLGIMGLLRIPLDMMTITIAAISIGIAVDDTIHYIYRFREEIKADGDYYRTLHRCHHTIGHAMYYTSVTIIIGFSILAFSNFWPTIYFGIFTSLAMLLALLAALTLLPQLLILIRPFPTESKNGSGHC